jgi:hypothetical protein
MAASEETQLRRYESRGETRKQFANSVFLLKGGASISTLAFLQSILTSKPDLVSPVAFTLLAFCLGLVFWALLTFIRPFVSLAHERPDKRLYRILHRFEIAFGVLPIVTFASGCLYLATAVIATVR